MAKENNHLSSFVFGAVAGVTIAYFLNDIIGIQHQAGKVAQGATVPPVAPALFAGGNTATSGQIGQTALTHGPANIIPEEATQGRLMAVDGKPAQNGYYFASRVWTQNLFCGATSIADAENRVCLAIARYIAAKLDKPINFYETPEFIAGVKQVYGKYVSQVAANIYPACHFKPFGNTIPSDHTQKDGVFDPTKQIADDMLHFGCLGAEGLQEYFGPNYKSAGDPIDCAGESAVADNSSYRTS